MDLFKTIAAKTGANDTVTIVVCKRSDDRLAVSVHVNNTKLLDPAKGCIAPLVVSGTPDELDNEFVEAIIQPVAESSGMQVSMENFEASKKVAEAASKKALEAKTKEKEAKAKADKALKEAETLAKGKKYAEAVKVLQKALSDAPEASKKTIQAAIEKYNASTAPDIFGAFEEDDAPATEAAAEPEAAPKGATDDDAPADEPEPEPEEEEENEEPEEEKDIPLDAEDF